MRLIDVQRLQSAVESITTCTAPSVQVGQLVARAGHLNSPCRSRHAVDFSPATQEIPYAVVRAWNSRHAVEIALTPISYTPAPRPVEGLVGEWVELSVPATFVRPVINLAQQLFFQLPFPVRDEKLVQAWVLTPRLAGYHFRQPVFYLADDDGDGVFQVPEDTVLQQGHLRIVPRDGLDIGGVWHGSQALFNHTLQKDEFITPDCSLARPVAVEYTGRIMCAVRFTGPARITSPDHDPLDVPEGSWLALHPFPGRRGEVD
jgi:hypothetical protein